MGSSSDRSSRKEVWGGSCDDRDLDTLSFIARVRPRASPAPERAEERPIQGAGLYPSDPSDAAATRVASDQPGEQGISLNLSDESEIDSIVHSLFSFSYSYDTSDTVSSRLLSVLRSLEKLHGRKNFYATPLGSSSALSLSLLATEDAHALSRARKGLEESNKVDSYIAVLEAAMKLPVIKSSAPSSQTRRFTVPIVAFRKESASWSRSISRFQKSPPLAPSEGSAISPTEESESVAMPLDERKVKLVEVLSMPYVDVSRKIETGHARPVKKPSLLRRASSFMSIPLFDGSNSQVQPQMQATCDPTPMFHIPAKHSSRNAVFTTSIDAPFAVRSLNDMACLMFGTSQSDAHNRPILEFVSKHLRNHLVTSLENGMNSALTTVLSGALLDIVKEGDVAGVASFWVERSANILIWVVEEISLHLEEFTVGDDRNTLIAMGTVGKHKIGITRISDIKKNLLNLEPDTLHYATVIVNGRTTPLLVSHHTDEDSEVTVRVREPCTVSAAVVLDPSFRIVSYNETVIHNLLGIRMGTDLRGQSIDAMIPKFNKYRAEIEKLCNVAWSPGVVIPEHMFRQVACLSPQDYFEVYPKNGMTAMTAIGNFVFVDVQLRILSENVYVLWVSYSNPPEIGEGSCIVPSQLDLLSTPIRQGLSGSSSPSIIDLLQEEPPVQPNIDRVGTPRKDLLVPAEEPSKKVDLPAESTETPSPSPEPTVVGARRRDLTLDDFEIMRPLGEGAYGSVSLARRKDQDPQVIVLKSIVKDRILVDTWTRDRRLGTIPNEIGIMNQLLQKPHPNIIRLIDFFEDSKCYHVEIACHGNPGIDLFDYIESHRDMSENQAREVFRQVVSAVAHLHSMGIVHRDIKDENIIVDDNGSVKLIDFGSAAHVNQGPFDVFVGTVDYAAPEVLGGLPFEGPQQDIWALGILLYTVLFKENPFYNVEEIMEASVRIPYDISVESTRLIHDTLIKDFHERPTAEWILQHPWFTGDSDS